MPSSFTPDVEAKLTEYGCRYVRTGRHPICYSPISNCNFPVPKGIKSRHTANGIMKQAGIPFKF